MPESLLTILKFLLLILLYLFFFRVLRAVWAEVGAPTTSTRNKPQTQPSVIGQRPGPTPRGTPARLKVVEPPESKGQTYDLADELTVGRAAGCQVRVEDGYASQLHARLFRRDGELYVEDLGSTNGTYVNRRGTSNKEKVTGPAVLRMGDRLVVGRTVLEVAK